MIELHDWPTPDDWKASILLEECGLPYRIGRPGKAMNDDARRHLFRGTAAATRD